MVLTSSGAAAPPAEAWPSPLAFCSCSANAAPSAWPADNDNSAAPTAAARRVRRNARDFMLLVLLLSGSLLLVRISWAEAFRCRRAWPSTIHRRPVRRIPAALVEIAVYRLRSRQRLRYSRGSSRGRRSGPTATYVRHASVTLTQIISPGLRSA